MTERCGGPPERDRRRGVSTHDEFDASSPPPELHETRRALGESAMRTYDGLMIGGGVIGLSLAYELAGHGWRVAVLERQAPGREASWAGAGILPPANRATARHPFDQLRGLSVELHASWAARLADETGIDTGYRKCGGIYVGRTFGEAASLHGWAGLLQEEQVRIQRLDDRELAECEPALAGALSERRVRTAYFLPDEAQLRNPWHLKALIAACQRRGVTLLADTEALDWRIEAGRVAAVETSTGPVTADRYCVTAGAWTQRLLARIGASAAVLPMRGQMLLFATDRPVCRRIVNDGPRYLVPREDGHLLVGSTEEEVGFDKRTTEAGLDDLRRFAFELVPALRDARLVDSWAGLRPASFDGLPYLGRVPGIANLFVAAGHFRSGLYLSPATAVVLGQLMRDRPPDVDLTPFSLLRA